MARSKITSDAIENGVIPVRSNTEPSSPNVGDAWFDTNEKVMKFYNGSAWKYSGLLPFMATGGTITESNGYRYHTFTTSGTITISGDDSKQIDYLVVAGGASAGGTATGLGGGGGGGAGGYISGNTYLNQGTYSIVIGAGGSAIGTGSLTQGNNGGNTTFNGLTAIGGGGGGYGNSGSNGKSGGSGGGQGYNGYSSGSGGGSGTAGQGNAGGNVSGVSASGGGGGGAGSAGASNTGSGGGIGGVGGAGSTWLDGNTYARGGDGGGNDRLASELPNSGNGGNGSYGSGAGRGAGGSGIVIIRYAI